MKLRSDNSLQLSATDLSNFIACKHKTHLDWQLARGLIAKPKGGDPYAEIVKELGNRHEAEYVRYLRRNGKQIADLSQDESGLDKVQRTERAMSEGAEIIIQGAFRQGQWMGYADILYKVRVPGKWKWSYEVGDTKLAQTTKAGTILQLCVYSDMLDKLQGVTPKHFYVIKPGLYESPEVFKFADYAAYYRYMQQALTQALENNDDVPYPVPVSFCDVCMWWQHCEKKRRADDHLCLVAGMQGSHVRQLNGINVNTMAGFAQRETAFDGRPPKGSIQTFQKLHRQARIQHRGKVENDKKYELLEPELTIEDIRESGLSRLPEPSEGDVFFDIEGDRFHEDGSLEYLLGIAFQENETWTYRAWWGLNRKDEKSAFEQLMDFLMRRLEAYPDYHIYHFAPYEPSALKHLMLRHSTRVEEVDWLLRGERLIDLYSIVKQSLIASVESYGLKHLEKFIDFKRNTELRNARLNLVKMQRALELNDPDEITDEVKETVRSYNEEDCRATQALRKWLEHLRTEYASKYGAPGRPSLKIGDASENSEEKRTRLTGLYDKLMAQLPEDEAEFSEKDKATHLVAHLLEYFIREDKNFWWEYFKRREMEIEDLREDRKAIVGLQYLHDLPPEGRQTVPRQVYSFPYQEVSMSGMEKVHDLYNADDEDAYIGELTDFDLKARTLTIRKSGKTADRHPTSIQLFKRFNTDNLEGGIIKIATAIAETGLQNALLNPATRDLLLKNEPRITGHRGPVRAEGDSLLNSAKHACANLNCSVLPLQGPPGTGKTYTGAHMILKLHQSGKRIGIAAVGHKVIDNLLRRIREEAVKKNISIELFHLGKEPESPPAGVTYVDKNTAPKVTAAGKLLGATVFHWSNPDCADTLDYLFIDEAGQMSLAYVLAASHCAKNLVLLGDPQQLEQPQQASHPEGSDISALSHYLGKDQTIDPKYGIFLDQTWRLHPKICEFTSALYYNNQLHALSGLDRQILRGNHPFAFNKNTGNPGAGMFFVPVDHSGNSNQSDEEINTIKDIVQQLLTDDSTWTFANDKGSEVHPLTQKDIMIIAPFNAQVAALRETLPDIPVGTVDKFQGGEAAVVIYSMASSSVEDAPRGMSFIFAPNRLNVASSRARCAFILVSSPKLFEVECNTPAQMEWANGMCRFREVAREVIL